MNGQAVTFDFHNTLASCPEWFDLEVRHLPSSFLRWWQDGNGSELPGEILRQADDGYRQLRREIMDHGNELTAEACLEQVFAAMQLEIPGAAISEGVAALMSETLRSTSPVPGAIDTVRELCAQGLTIGVISSAVYHPFLEWALASFGILGDFRAVITSASAGYYKSRPELFLYAAEAIGADPARTVHVGDSLRFDVGGASRAGMGTVWLQHGEPTSGERKVEPDLILQTLDGSAPRIMRLLQSRNGRPGHVRN